VMQNEVVLNVCPDSADNNSVKTAPPQIYRGVKVSGWMGDGYEVSYANGCTPTSESFYFLVENMLLFMPATVGQGFRAADADLSLFVTPDAPPKPIATLAIADQLVDEQGQPHGLVVALVPANAGETYMYGEYFTSRFGMQRRGWYWGDDFFESWFAWPEDPDWTVELVTQQLSAFLTNTAGWVVTIEDWREAAAAGEEGGDEVWEEEEYNEDPDAPAVGYGEAGPSHAAPPM